MIRKKKPESFLQTQSETESLEKIIENYDKEKKSEEQKKIKAKDKAKKQFSQDKKTQKKQTKLLLKNITLKIIDLIPLKKPVDFGETGIELVTGGYMNIYKIKSHDYRSATDVEVALHIYSWEKSYRTTSNDRKLVAINMPVDVASNIRFHMYKYQQTNNPLYRELLSRIIDEFRYELSDREDKSFYIFLFGNSYKDMLKINAQFEASIVAGGYADIIEYSEKIEVFKKFSNPYNNVLRPELTSYI